MNFPRVSSGISFPSNVYERGYLIHFGLSDRCEGFATAILKRSVKMEELLH